MLWYGAAHFGGWGGRGGLTLGRVTDTRSGTYNYNSINSSWDSSPWQLVINPLGGNVGIGTKQVGQKLHVNGNIALGDGTQAGYLQVGPWYIDYLIGSNYVGVDGFRH